MKARFKVSVIPCHGKRICDRTKEKSKTEDNASPVRAARMLTLAHHIERLIEIGKLKDYSHAAAVLKVSRARLSQIMDLLLLSPDIQESILTGNLVFSEHQLRAVTRQLDWREQCKRIRQF